MITVLPLIIAVNSVTRWLLSHYRWRQNVRRAPDTFRDISTSSVSTLTFTTRYLRMAYVVKISIIPEFYIIFARKKISGLFFLGGEAHAPSPVDRLRYGSIATLTLSLINSHTCGRVAE